MSHLSRKISHLSEPQVGTISHLREKCTPEKKFKVGNFVLEKMLELRWENSHYKKARAQVGNFPT